MKNTYNYKCSPGGVGKSALTVQFVSGRFVERYDPTVEDFYRKEIEVDGERCFLEILDTAGTEQFASMRDLYIKNGQGFVIVYSLTSRQSFEDMKLIRDQILRVKGTTKVPIVLAANKCDLVDREVTSLEGCTLANEYNIPYMETSALNSSIVNSLFCEIVNEINIKKGNYGSQGRKNKSKQAKRSPSISANLSREQTIQQQQQLQPSAPYAAVATTPIVDKTNTVVDSDETCIPTTRCCSCFRSRSSPYTGQNAPTNMNPNKDKTYCSIL